MGPARCGINTILLGNCSPGVVVSVGVYIAPTQYVVRVDVCTRSPLPRSLEVGNGSGWLPQAVQRQPAHLHGFGVSGILRDRLSEIPIGVGKLASSVIRDAEFTMRSF